MVERVQLFASPSSLFHLTQLKKKNPILLVKNYYNEGEDKKGGRRVGGEDGYFKADKTVR